VTPIASGKIEQGWSATPDASSGLLTGIFRAMHFACLRSWCKNSLSHLLFLFWCVVVANVFYQGGVQRAFLNITLFNEG